MPPEDPTPDDDSGFDDADPGSDGSPGAGSAGFGGDSLENADTPRLNFVCSYPKSGNTWVRLFVAAFQMGPTGDFQRFVQYDDVARFDFQSICPISVDRIGIDVQAALRPAALLVLARKISAPVLVKSHHACGQVNGLELWMPQWTGSVVVPVRDPRDVCCSVKHHFGMDSYQEAAEFMAHTSATIGGGKHEKMAHMLGTWSDHVGSWWRTERIETHLVRYEDLHENPLEEFTSILRFLGIEDPDPERVEMAEEAVRFDRLQEVEEKSGFPETSEHQEKFFRRGAAGGWTDELPPEVARKIEEDHAEMMDTLGYEPG